MSRAVAAVAVTPLASMLAVLALALPAAGAAPRPATLKLVSLSPLTVTGRNFGARETVLLTYLSPEGASKLASARATRSGRFRAVFRLRVGRCESFTVRAAGTAGSRAILQVARRCGTPAGPPEQGPRKPKKP